MELTSKDFFDFQALLRESQVIELDKVYRVKEMDNNLLMGEVVVHDSEFWEANEGHVKIPIWLKNDNFYQLLIATRPQNCDQEDLVEANRCLNIGSQQVKIGLYPEIFKIEDKKLFLENKRICSCITLNIVKTPIFDHFRLPRIQK